MGRHEQRPRGIYSPWGGSVREFCLEPFLRGGRWLALGRGQWLRRMPSQGSASCATRPSLELPLHAFICGIVAALCLLLSLACLCARCDRGGVFYMKACVLSVVASVRLLRRPPRCSPASRRADNRGCAARSMPPSLLPSVCMCARFGRGSAVVVCARRCACRLDVANIHRHAHHSSRRRWTCGAMVGYEARVRYLP